MKPLYPLVILALVGCGGGEESSTTNSENENDSPNFFEEIPVEKFAPIVTIQSDVTTIVSGETITDLSAVAFDLDGRPVSYSWSASSTCSDGIWTRGETLGPTFTTPNVDEITECTVTITAFDDDGLSGQDTLSFHITPREGVLAMSWNTGDPSVDPDNKSQISPFADIADDGSVIGAWFVSLTGRNGVEGGSLENDSSEWSLQGILSASDESLHDNYQRPRLVVESAANGYSIAVWSSTNLIDSTESLSASFSFGDGSWSVPKKIVESTRAQDIKASINTSGRSAITWLDSDNEIRLLVLDSLGNRAGEIRNIGNFSVSRNHSSRVTFFYSEGFNVRINESGEVMAVAVSNKLDGDMRGLYLYRHSPSSGHQEPVLLSSDARDHYVRDVDMEMSPSGNVFVAWQQLGDYNNEDVKGRLYSISDGWGDILDLETSNDADFVHPQVDINDAGEVVLAVGYEGPDDGGLSDIYISRMDTEGNWTELQKIHTYGYSSVDVAIDQYGHSVIIYEDLSDSRVGIFTKDGSWTNRQSLGDAGGYGHFLGQRLRMNPRGQAIVTWIGYQQSGFRVLR